MDDLNIEQKLVLLIEQTLRERVMTYQEREVLELIFKFRRLHQCDIIKQLPHLGRHEQDVEIFDNQSTTRKVRQIVRDIRLKFKVPILSDREGYFLPSSQQEIVKWMNDMERASKARTIASIQTYESMKEASGIVSNYFEKQLELTYE